MLWVTSVSVTACVRPILSHLIVPVNAPTAPGTTKDAPKSATTTSPVRGTHHSPLWYHGRLIWSTGSSASGNVKSCDQGNYCCDDTLQDCCANKTNVFHLGVATIIGTIYATSTVGSASVSTFVAASSVGSTVAREQTSTEILRASTSPLVHGSSTHVSSNAVPIGVGVGVGVAAGVLLANFLYLWRRQFRKRNAKMDGDFGTIVCVHDDDKEMVAAVEQQRLKDVLQQKMTQNQPEYHAHGNIAPINK